MTNSSTPATGSTRPSVFDSGRPELTVVIPAFNEAARLPATLAALAEHFTARPASAEVVFVDDGSRDATPELLAGAAEAMPEHVRVRVERHSVQSGKGAAVRTGCLAAGGRLVVYVDADLAVPLAEIDRIVDALRGSCAVAIGTRVQPDGSDMRAGQPLVRRVSGKAFTWTRRVLAVPDIIDTQCPLKGFRAEVVPALFGRQRLTGWTFDAELLFLARRQRLPICQLPVVWRHMEGSKLRPGAKLALRSLRDLVVMRWVHLRD